MKTMNMPKSPLIHATMLTLVLVGTHCAPSPARNEVQAAPSDGAAATTETAAPEPVRLEDLDLTLEEETFIDKQNDYFAEEVASANAKCGTSLKGAIDWVSFLPEVRKQLAGEQNYSVYDHCSASLRGLAQLCESVEPAKDRAKKRLNAYQCDFGGAGARGIEINGKTLRWTVDWEQANTGRWAEDYLKKNL